MSYIDYKAVTVDLGQVGADLQKVEHKLRALAGIVGSQRIELGLNALATDAWKLRVGVLALLNGAPPATE